METYWGALNAILYMLRRPRALELARWHHIFGLQGIDKPSCWPHDVLTTTSTLNMCLIVTAVATVYPLQSFAHVRLFAVTMWIFFRQCFLGEAFRDGKTPVAILANKYDAVTSPRNRCLTVENVCIALGVDTMQVYATSYLQT